MSFPSSPCASVAMPVKSQFNWKFHSCTVFFRDMTCGAHKNAVDKHRDMDTINLFWTAGFNCVCPPFIALVSCQTCPTGKINCGRVPEWRRNWPSSLAAPTSTALSRLIIQIIVSRRRSSFVFFASHKIQLARFSPSSAGLPIRHYAKWMLLSIWKTAATQFCRLLGTRMTHWEFA